MNEKHDSAADVRLERIVSLRPCPFCGGKCDPQGWYDGHGVGVPECETCGATAYSELEWNRRAYDKRLRDLGHELDGVIEDVEHGQGGKLDAVCIRTLRRVRAALAQFQQDNA